MAAMASPAPQFDLFIAAISSAQFLRGITEVLTQRNVHLQAVFAFEALGKELYATPELIDQGITALGGNESIVKIELMRFFGSRKDDIASYLRKSTPCVKSLLLITCLKACQYNTVEVAVVLFEMLSVSGLLGMFPVSVQQMEQLVLVLLPQIQYLSESFAMCNMQILNDAMTCPDMKDIEVTCQKLQPSTMGKLLLHGFKALTSPSTSFTELRGSTGLFDVATIFVWLAPDKVALCLTVSEAHPSYRKPVIGTTEHPLLIQAASGGGWQNHDTKTDAMFGWKVVSWMSPKAMAANALSWVGIAKPLLKGDAARFGGVALSVAKKLVL